MSDSPPLPTPTPNDGAISPTETMKWAGWIGGLVFIVLIVILALWVPNPTGFQEWAFRVPMSIGAASFAAFVPGFLIVQAFTKKEDKQAGICGGGAIVVFVLLMYVNPTRLGVPAAKFLGTPAAGATTQSTSTNNTGPGGGAIQTAGRDINNIQAGGNVTIGDPINVADIAKDFRQPLRRMVEITEI